MTNYFAKNLKYLRKKKKIEQQIMAEDLGVAQSTLSCWENGIRTPDLDTIAKIAKYLNIYENFITNDLTEKSTESFNELDLLWLRKKDILTKDDKDMIKYIFKHREQEIKEKNKQSVC